MFSAKNLDIDAFALGLFIGAVLVSVIWAAAFAQNDNSVPTDFYTCTYSAIDPQSEMLKGVFCWGGNATGDPCPFDLYTQFVGTFYVKPEEIEQVNSFNSKTPDGQKGKWNVSLNFSSS